MRILAIFFVFVFMFYSTQVFAEVLESASYRISGGLIVAGNSSSGSLNTINGQGNVLSGLLLSGTYNLSSGSVRQLLTVISGSSNNGVSQGIESSGGGGSGLGGVKWRRPSVRAVFFDKSIVLLIRGSFLADVKKLKEKLYVQNGTQDITITTVRISATSIGDVAYTRIDLGMSRKLQPVYLVTLQYNGTSKVLYEKKSRVPMYSIHRLAATRLSSNASVSCVPIFDVPLEKGAFGGQVFRMQKFLRTHGFFNRSPSGWFGLETEQAVRDFQKAYTEDILIPSGLGNVSSGKWFWYTRTKANQLHCLRSGS